MYNEVHPCVRGLALFTKQLSKACMNVEMFCIIVIVSGGIPDMRIDRHIIKCCFSSCLSDYIYIIYSLIYSILYKV